MTKVEESDGSRSFVSYSIRRSLAQMVQVFVENRWDPNCTNPSQFVDAAIREKLMRDTGGKSVVR